MEERVRFSLPKLCVKCGEKEGSKKYKLETSYTEHYVVAGKTHTFKFYVPICDGCLSEIERRKIYELIVYVVSAGFGLLVSVLIAIINGGDTQNILNGIYGLGIIGIFGGLILGLIINAFIRLEPMSLGGYDGKYFYFSNPEFQRKFAELNPNLIKPGIS